MILWLSITMTHVFFFFLSDYQERMEHGRGALQPLNLFLFLEPASLFQFPHVFFSKCLTPLFFVSSFKKQVSQLGDIEPKNMAG